MTKGTRQAGKAAARKPGPAAAKDGLRDDSGAWAAGLRSDAHAALLGRIVGMMPQVEAVASDLAARLLGRGDLAARTILRGLADDAARLDLLDLLARRGAGADERTAAVARYAAARKRWQSYVGGLWYTHDSGRAFLAPPDTAGSAAFRVAREVKPAELAAEAKRLIELSETLARLAERPAAVAAELAGATPAGIGPAATAGGGGAAQAERPAARAGGRGGGRRRPSARWSRPPLRPCRRQRNRRLRGSGLQKRAPPPSRL